MDSIFNKLDKVYEDSDFGLDYDFLERIAEKIVNIYIPDNNYEHKIHLDIADTIEICCDFAKTLGNQYYNFFVKKLFCCKTYIFKKNDNINNKIVGLDNFPIRDYDCVFYDNNDYRVYIPITNTINDVYCIIHEISHLIKIASNEKLSKNLFSETLPFIFEKLLTIYLTDKFFNNKELLIHDLNRQINVREDALDCLYYFSLINTKLKYGKITYENFINHTKDMHYFNYLSEENLKSNIDDYSVDRTEYLVLLKYIVANLVSVNLISEGKSSDEIIHILNNFTNNIYFKGSLRDIILNNKNHNEIIDKFKMLNVDITDKDNIDGILNNYKKHTKKLVKDFSL